MRTTAEGAEELPDGKTEASSLGLFVSKMRRLEVPLKKVFIIPILLLAFAKTSYSEDIAERFDKGVILLKAGRYQDAISAFQKVVELKRDYAEGWSHLGRACIGAGRYQDGLNAFEEAVHWRPERASFWVGKGDSLLLLGRTDEAIKVFEKAIELDGNQDAAWYGKARCHALKADKEVALKHLSRAIELNAHYKNKAYRDRAFWSLWNDQDFKRIVEL